MEFDKIRAEITKITREVLIISTLAAGTTGCLTPRDAGSYSEPPALAETTDGSLFQGTVLLSASPIDESSDSPINEEEKDAFKQNLKSQINRMEMPQDWYVSKAMRALCPDISSEELLWATEAFGEVNGVNPNVVFPKPYDFPVGGCQNDWQRGD